jgi:hypothetical protein
VRIAFGIHQGKTVGALSTDALQSFSDWLEEHPIARDAPVKWRLERAHLMSAVARELGEREDETEEEDVLVDGPIPLGRLLTSAEKNVYLGLVFLLDRNDGQQPFPATFEVYAEIFGGSKTSWTSAREKLIHHGYLTATARGEVAFLNPSDSTDATQYCRKPLFLLCSFVGESKETTLITSTVSPLYQTVDKALEILGAQNSVDEKFKHEARKKLRKLLSGSRGYTVRDALTVAQWGRRMYDTGEERWHKMVDLQYLWNPAHFAASLIAAHSAPAKKVYSITADPTEREELHQEWLDTLKRKGQIK